MWVSLVLLLGIMVTVRYFRRRVVGDIDMLAFGAMLYIALPFVAFQGGWLLEFPGIELWRSFFEAAAARSNLVAALTLGLGAAYLLGRWLASATAARPGARMDRPLSAGMLGLVATGLWLVWGATVSSNSGSFFKGYAIEYDTELLGALATVNLLVLAVVLNCRQYGQRGLAYRALCVLLLVNSVALLSLGGRLYVIIAVVGLLLQSLATEAGRRGRWRRFLLLCAVVTMLLAVGVLRIGADFSLDFAAYIGVAEGLFTSISLGSFLENNGLPAISLPSNFFGSMVNFVPSALFPNKVEWIPTVQQTGHYFESPLGATHLYVALLGNFGWVGSLAFAVGLGWLLGAVKRVSPTGWWLYFYLCSLLPFMLFRDGFSIFNKAAVFNCLLLWLLIMFDRLLSVALRPVLAPSAAAAT